VRRNNVTQFVFGLPSREVLCSARLGRQSPDRVPPDQGFFISCARQCPPPNQRRLL